MRPVLQAQFRDSRQAKSITALTLHDTHLEMMCSPRRHGSVSLSAMTKPSECVLAQCASTAPRLSSSSEQLLPALLQRALLSAQHCLNAQVVQHVVLSVIFHDVLVGWLHSPVPRLTRGLL